MAMGVNKVIILGNVGKDPEIRYTAGGMPIANISIATGETWKDKKTGEKKESTEWHRIVFYDRLAEIVSEYVRKGTKVYVEGKLKTRKWQDKDTGQDRYATDIQATSLQLLGSTQNNAEKTTSLQSHSEGSENEDFDEIPF